MNHSHQIQQSTVAVAEAMHQVYRSWSDLFFGANFDLQNLSINELIIFWKPNWTISLYVASFYLALVYFGGRWMSKRTDPFDLRRPLAVWSGVLAMFSAMATVRVWPELIAIYRTRGLIVSYCDNSFINNHLITYWFLMFAFSKIPELFDTAFVVLRKQRLIPLHWIHHSLTMVYVFYTIPYKAGSFRWMASMNLLVHSLMYSYYCLKALRVPIPRPIAVSITLLQISQMFVGLAIHSHILWMHYHGTALTQCPDSPLNVSIPGLLMYLLYFYFFIKFFVDRNQHRLSHQLPNIKKD